MKKFIILIFVVLIGLGGFIIIRKQQTAKAGSKNKLENQRLVGSNNLHQAVLSIDGMFCASCAIGAEYALKEKEGVISASVDYDTKKSKVVYDPAKISTTEIIEAIKPYTATIIEDKLAN